MRLPVIALATLCIALPAIAAEPGTEWEVTASMEMGGMKMPGTTNRFCAPEGADDPETMAKGGDERCQMSDVRQSPGRFSYKVTCPDGAGTGEMVWDGNDSYTTRMTMTMDGETMQMVQKGRRLGSCDASVMKKQAAAIQAQGAAAQKQVCASGPEQMNPYMLTAMGADCDPKYRQELCAKFGTRAGFRKVAVRKPTGSPEVDAATLPEVAKYCGVQAEPLQARLCTEAGQVEDLGFIGGWCPDLAQPIAQRECAGRSHSAPPAEKYRGFCNRYGRGVMEGEEDAEESGDASGAPASVVPTPADLMKEGTKRLKGLFGR